MINHSRPSSAPLLVTAALIRQSNPVAGAEDLVFVARRKNDHPVEGGKWEFPGGKVEPCEHPETGLVREIREELSLEIAVESFFDLSSHVYELPDRRLHIVLLCYQCRIRGDADFTLTDHSEARWVTTAEMKALEFAAADIPFVEKWIREIG